MQVDLIVPVPMCAFDLWEPLESVTPGNIPVTLNNLGLLLVAWRENAQLRGTTGCLNRRLLRITLTEFGLLLGDLGKV